MRPLIDSIFAPATNFLNQADTMLSGLSLGIRRGLDLSYYLGPVAYLGPGWTAVVTTLLSGAAVVVTLLTVRTFWNLYLDLKAGVKWW